MDSSDFPFEIRELEQESREKMNRISEYSPRFLQIGPNKYIVPMAFRRFGPEIYNFQMRSDDVCLMGHTRTASRATQELIWLLCNNLDYESAKFLSPTSRFSSLETIYYAGSTDLHEEIIQGLHRAWERLKNRTDKRLIKTHLPFSCSTKSLLTSGCKIIYTIRDPREVIVSNFMISQKLCRKEISFRDYWDCFKKGLVLWGPYTEHTKEALALVDNQNILIVSHDQIVEDSETVIKKVVQFLGKTISEIDVIGLKYHLETCNFLKTYEAFPNVPDNFKMKHVRDTNRWRKYFVGDLERELEEYMEQNFKGIDFKRVTIPDADP